MVPRLRLRPIPRVVTPNMIYDVKWRPCVIHDVKWNTLCDIWRQMKYPVWYMTLNKGPVWYMASNEGPVWYMTSDNIRMSSNLCTIGGKWWHWIGLLYLLTSFEGISVISTYFKSNHLIFFWNQWKMSKISKYESWIQGLFETFQLDH